MGSDYKYCYEETGVRHEWDDESGNVHVARNGEICSQWFDLEPEGYRLVNEQCARFHYLFNGEPISDDEPMVEINVYRGEYTYDDPDTGLTTCTFSNRGIYTDGETRQEIFERECEPVVS